MSGSRSAVPSPLVSAQMSRMPTKNTTPELLLRRELFRRRLRYRIHRADLPGRPDIAFATARVAVFVDGCFWHACPAHGSLPKNNREWWQSKFDATRERDRVKDDSLRSFGWEPIHVWEHEDVAESADRIEKLIAARHLLPARRRTRMAGS